MRNNSLILFILFLFPLMSFSPGRVDYQKHYGQSYQSALNFCQTNNGNFQKTAQKYRLNPLMLKAVVFPELLRYNVLKDLIETAALELVYIDNGNKAVDFSIGHFQMKTSFAEKIEAIAAEDENCDWSDEFQGLCSYNETDEKKIRKERLKRLTNLDWQLKYLAFFFKYAELNLKNIQTAEDKIKWIATLYNCGIKMNEQHLKKWMDVKCFPYGTSVPAKIQHNYSEIALDFYLRNKN